MKTYFRRTLKCFLMCTFVIVSLFSEWDSALLWIWSSWTPDILVPSSLSTSCTNRNARWVASATERTDGWENFDLRPLWALWPQLSGWVPVVAQCENAGGVGALRSHHRTSSGETAAAWQPDQSSAKRQQRYQTSLQEIIWAFKLVMLCLNIIKPFTQWWLELI